MDDYPQLFDYPFKIKINNTTKQARERVEIKIDEIVIYERERMAFMILNGYMCQQFQSKVIKLIRSRHKNQASTTSTSI